jgi:hypothetical protein
MPRRSRGGAEEEQRRSRGGAEEPKSVALQRAYFGLNRNNGSKDAAEGAEFHFSIGVKAFCTSLNR